MSLTFSRLTFIAVLLAYIVIILGAYVRLSNAGLGCPDWPGCYGQMIISGQWGEIDSGRAWKEMIHRYAAGLLGFMISVIFIVALKQRREDPNKKVLPSSILLALVIFQALLGMWTVTLKLQPFVVMAHLLGGFATLSLLWWMYVRGGEHAPEGLRPLTTVALFILILQIALGGWMSANYASLACPDFPTCQGQLWPNMNFSKAFLMWQQMGINYEGGLLDNQARMAIHVMHRIGALATFIFFLFLSLKCMLKQNIRPIRRIRLIGLILLLLLCLQLSLGILNVVLSLPLIIAVAHNGVAALLLLTLITLKKTLRNQ